ncbi:hypothetical protein KW842_01080 [Duganella sp. sic0402]|uniref:hypothetical protein n=1 Tax=Duganella sp. sic0402 TaxID=2854786 RepID=UPI001C4468B2|nr:hypothetical protein [Duganella sp. sic0402]MBV7534347.1 hypothetical protein [Duganella sp. sic0402]
MNLTANATASAALVFAWLCLLRWARHSGWGIALLTLIGTIGHEALHALVGWLVCARPTSFSIIPKRQKNGWLLGSVGFRNLNIWNAAPAAFAPLLLAWAGWLVFVHWMQPAFHDHHYLSWLLAGYVAAVALFSCVPSSVDIRMGASSALMYCAVCALAGVCWMYYA